MAAFNLYVRGAAADVLVDDLGFTVPQGPSWTQLNVEKPGDAAGEGGQFTAREIRNSADLKALIASGDLEWSKNGSDAETAGSYVADFMLMQDFTDDHLDLTSGILTLPTSAPSPAQEGDVYFDPTTSGIQFYNGNSWEQVGGSGADDDSGYALLAGNNVFTGSNSFSSTSGLILPTGNGTSSFETVLGDVVFNSADDQMYIYTSNGWMSIPMMLSGVLDHGTLFGLGDDDHPQYHDGSLPYTGNLNMGGNSISGVNLVDGVDVSALEGQVSGIQSWIDAYDDSDDITDHGALTGLGDDDHPQYHDGSLPWTGNINVGGNSISGVNLVDGVDVSALYDIVTGLQAVEDDDPFLKLDGTSVMTGDINMGGNSISGVNLVDGVDVSALYSTVTGIEGGSIQLDHGMLSGLLDDDHPQYTEWAQNETVTGLWTFNPAAATEPNLVLTPRSATPTVGNTDGAVAVIGGILCTYDSTRGKWLSVDRKILMGSKDGSAKDVYLRVDNIAMSQTGIRALRAGTITGIFLEADAAASWTFEVRRNGSVAVLASLASGGAQGAQVTTTNVDFAQGNELQFFANTSGGTILAPIAGIEIAWKM